MAGKKGGLGMTGLDKMFGGRKPKGAPAARTAVEEKQVGEAVGEVPVKNLQPTPPPPRPPPPPAALRAPAASTRQSGAN